MGSEGDSIQHGALCVLRLLPRSFIINGNEGIQLWLGFRQPCQRSLRHLNRRDLTPGYKRGNRRSVEPIKVGQWHPHAPSQSMIAKARTGEPDPFLNLSGIA